jgi:hypothetical protein
LGWLRGWGDGRLGSGMEAGVRVCAATAVGSGLAGWRRLVGWIELWAESEVCCSLIREYRRDFSYSNMGTVNTVGKHPPLFQ